MKKILVTGGPVHAYIDPVKIITNRFKGGMMAELADNLCAPGPSLDNNEVTYLCAKGSVLPSRANDEWKPGILTPPNKIKLAYHDGSEDYRTKVKELAKDMDAVVLGAAVANLIPLHPLKEKFPSHNYKVGDVIPIDFTIAPRVIDEVKAVMKPGAHLFGFKLLAGQPHEELIRAAYGVLLESHATAVFANDPTVGLKKKFSVTKERGVQEMGMADMPRFILNILDDVYYASMAVESTKVDFKEAWANVEMGLDYYRNIFEATPEGYVFGTIAWRVEKEYGIGFVTTARGKKETANLVYVVSVKHDLRGVFVYAPKPSTSKATLNAPLLARIFEKNPNVHGILHFHRQEKGLPVQEWAPPGTVRDTERDVSKPFNVLGHGCYLFVDKRGKVLA